MGGLMSPHAYAMFIVLFMGFLVGVGLDTGSAECSDYDHQDTDTDNSDG